MRPDLLRPTAYAIAALAVLGAMNSWRVSADYARNLPDAYGVANAQARLAPILERIPAQARLGYLTDLDRSQKAFAPSILAAQYALAPRLLIDARAADPPEWAVGNFAQPGDFQALGAGAGYELDRDYGNGVVLYRRKAR